MWFGNAIAWQYTLDEPLNLADALAGERLKPCPPHARFVEGWANAIGDELVAEVSGCALICMGREERILPRGVVMQMLAERIEAMEAQQGRPVKRAEKAQMAEDLEFELLPKAFCVQKRLTALLDTAKKRLIINTSSANQASRLVALLRKSVPGIHLEPLKIPDNLSYRLATWINDPASVPAGFSLAADCLLYAPDNEKKRFACKGCELPADEVLGLLAQGLAPSEISLIWNERVQLTLTDEMVLKRLKCLDYLTDEFMEIRDLEEEYLQRDAELALLSGELRTLLDALMAALPASAEHASFPDMQAITPASTPEIA